jgi:hypothetical protein
MVNLKLPSYAFSKFAVLCGLCDLQWSALREDCHKLRGSKRELLRNAGGPHALCLSWRRAGPSHFSPRQHHQQRYRAFANSPATNPSPRRRSPRRLQNARPRPLDQHRGPLAAGLRMRHRKRSPRPQLRLPPGVEMWDNCPTGGKGVDAATMVVSESGTGDADKRKPAPPSRGGDISTSGTTANLRSTFAQTIAALSAMLATLLAAVLLSLKSRDVP